VGQRIANELQVTDTPPNAASVAIVRDSKVLLIKRAYAPYQHLWTLPGGRLEAGETIEQCAIREIREEVGLTIRNPRPVMVQSLGQDGAFRLAVFATRDFSGQLRASDEVADHQWIDLSALIALRTTSRLDDVLARAFAVLAQS
jgi:8-oxo-dGTP diphosphatase